MTTPTIPSSPMMGKPTMRSVSSGSVTTSTMPSPLRVGGKPTLRSMSSSGATPNVLQQSMAKSMTIDEMRQYHQRALNDAEAKRTELRLVLASRYRELVGSSDEVMKMRERSQELHQLVHALPSLMTKLGQVQQSQKPLSTREETKSGESKEDDGALLLLQLRRDLSRLPRLVHRSLDKQDVYKATTCLIQLFDLIASQTNKYELANSLSSTSNNDDTSKKLLKDPLLKTQMKMTYLHIESIPARIIRMTERVLLECAQSAQQTASALASLHLLKRGNNRPSSSSIQLLDLYFDSKAKLLQSLLRELGDADTTTTDSTTTAAEDILTKIVGILQRDIILYPYLMFVKQHNDDDTFGTMLQDLPIYHGDVVRSKASNYLAAHLPLIRTKVKTVLVSIAGTTASALGHIRQTLYDKTDGMECLKQLEDASSGPGTWDDAVHAMVDVRIVLAQGGAAGTTTSGSNSSGVLLDRSRGDSTSSLLQQQRSKFSLWSALFSNTFSSLVHSLLTTSFHSVHARVVSTLRTSLANAPTPFEVMLPQEAYRNTLKIATELDQSIVKVSDDAHELLIHAEERVESECRLRESLYVQCCEIMGRLVCELRRMLLLTPGSDGTKEFLVGRLCHLLLFRLTSLPKLLNPHHAPGAGRGSSSSTLRRKSSTTTSGGMITLLELQSAFDLADDNEDGLITFEEAMEAVDSAFSGTQFHGAEMIRETLLLNNNNSKEGDGGGVGTTSGVTTTTSTTVAPPNVTLHELVLLSARGLRHDSYGPNSALGTIHQALNHIIQDCFTKWAQIALKPSIQLFQSSLDDFLTTITTTDEQEWQRMYGGSSQQGNTSTQPTEFADYMLLNEDEMVVASTPKAEPIIGNVSQHLIGYLLTVSSILNRSVCPSDSRIPPLLVMNQEEQDNDIVVPNMMSIIRLALLKQSLQILVGSYDERIKLAMEEGGNDDENQKKQTLQDSNTTSSGLIQLNMDISFLQLIFFQRNQYGFEWNNDNDDNMKKKDSNKYKNQLEMVFRLVDRLLRMANRTNYSNIIKITEERHVSTLEITELFLSSLLGESSASTTSSEMDDDFGMTSSIATSTPPPPTLHPLSSTRRFGLLPIQSDRSLSELQARRRGAGGGKYGKDNKQDNEASNKESTTGSSVMSSFFSSMLKKK